MYGTQTVPATPAITAMFENDVKMYGTQTRTQGTVIVCGFENDVKMYGTQTMACGIPLNTSLRMM